MAKTVRVFDKDVVPVMLEDLSAEDRAKLGDYLGESEGGLLTLGWTVDMVIQRRRDHADGTGSFVTPPGETEEFLGLATGELWEPMIDPEERMDQ